ncbi:ionotropic receptor 60a [Sergentomyia squamirostris]
MIFSFRAKTPQSQTFSFAEEIIATRVESCRDGKIDSLKTLQVQRLDALTMQLQNCNLKICCQVSPPFVEEDCMDGIEMSMISIMRERMQFLPEIICTNMTRGEVENGEPSDLLAELKARRCDLLIGSFFPDNDLEDFGESVTYLADSYTWFAPLADYTAPWKSLLIIFYTSTWALLIFSLIWTGMMWFVLGKYSFRENHHHRLFILCLLNAWQVLLGISANNRPRFTPLRIIFLSLALYGLNIATIYTSKLIIVFTHPSFDDQIDSMEKILKSGLPFGGRTEYLDWFRNDEDQVILDRFNTSVNFQPNVASLKRVEDRKQILLANRMFVLSNNYNSRIYGFPENVFSNPMEIITTKGFPLMLDFNNIINTLKDCGILNKLCNDFMYKITILLHIRNHQSNIESDTVLTVNHLQGAFIILMYGYLISILMFTFEIIRQRWF